MALTTLCFDADDTLWDNEIYFREAHGEFCALMADYARPDTVLEKLLVHEVANLHPYGFGVKGFVLSMVETAIELSNGQVSATVIEALLAIGKRMLTHPVTLMDGVYDTLESLSQNYRLFVITKGDLLDQERKFALSGLAGFVERLEVVSHKSARDYQDIFTRHGLPPQSCMMIGNSMKSDILPVLEIGGRAVFIPQDLTWVVEQAEEPHNNDRYFTLERVADLPALMAQIERGAC